MNKELMDFTLNLKREELNSQIQLLNQYKKELDDILMNKGLARGLSKGELRAAEINLRDSIKSAEKAIDYIEKEIEEMEEGML